MILFGYLLLGTSPRVGEVEPVVKVSVWKNIAGLGPLEDGFPVLFNDNIDIPVETCEL